tara:strand:+ start:737 stop:868 length:132 start_codon:yes stop_codon:yes gene_type:complete
MFFPIIKPKIKIKLKIIIILIIADIPSHSIVISMFFYYDLIKL